MRWLHISIVAFAMLLCVSTQAEARRRVVTTYNDDGTVSTTVVRNHGWHHGYAWGHNRVLGAPVYVRRGFPRFPVDGQRVWRAGRLWRYDAALGQWEILR